MAESSLTAESFLGIVSCEICFQDFNDVDILPRVLFCGHTFCAQCLRRIFEEKETECLCPKCKTPIRKRLVKDIPINFSVLQINDKFLSSAIAKDDKDELRRSLTKRKELRRRLSEKKKKLFEKGDNLNELIDSKISSLVTLGGANEIENLLEMINVSFKKDFNIEKTFEKQVAFTLKDFQEPQHFLHQIYVRLVKGEKMYSMHLHANKIKYGRIKLHYEQKDKIFVNSLTLDEVAEEGAAYLLFSDIKKCATADNYETFLKFRYAYECKSEKFFEDNFLRMKMICNGQSNVSQRFVNLCTAETGRSLEEVLGNSFNAEIFSAGINVPAEMPTVSEDTTWPMTTAFKEDVLRAVEEDTLVISRDCDQSSLILFSENANCEDTHPSLMRLIKYHPENIIGFLQERVSFFSTMNFLESGITFKI